MTRRVVEKIVLFLRNILRDCNSVITLRAADDDGSIGALLGNVC